MVKIGHARYNEISAPKGGLPGDQTHKEVLTQSWYNGNWTHVFRAKDSKVAEKIAIAMECSCANNNIGYNQAKRTTLYEQAKIVNWNISSIANKCDCDCSSLVAVCVNAAGIKVSKNMYTGNQKDVLTRTGKFKIFTGSEYLTQSKYLKRGDILLCPGHTAIVISGLEETHKLEAASNFSKSLAGTYIVTSQKLNIRRGAGITKQILTVIDKGLRVVCFGYYTKELGTNWLYIQFNLGGKLYTGFASSRYLEKIV